MRVIHERMNVVVGPLQKCELKGLAVKSLEVVVWKCVHLLVSYRWDISEAKERSTA